MTEVPLLWAKADGTLEAVHVPQGSPSAMRRLVGGNLTVTFSRAHRITIYADDEGYYDPKRPVNVLASLVRGVDDWPIVGDVVMAGEPGPSGEDTALTGLQLEIVGSLLSSLLLDGGPKGPMAALRAELEGRAQVLRWSLGV